MALRKIRQQFSTVRDDVEDLITRRALPTEEVEQIDPFLFLNHHGPQVYPKNNEGLPFGPHPHRGFETVTFILEGDLAHKDTGGHESVIKEGGVQWMTAGSGLVHSELSPNEFMKSGGPLEILQLWVNLPSKLKMTKPNYVGLQKDEIPTLNFEDGKVQVNLISGRWDHQFVGPVHSLTDVAAMTIYFKTHGKLKMEIREDRNIFFYVVKGSLKINGETCEQFHLVEFENSGEELQMEALSDAIVLLCHAPPLNEPVVHYGPFVMNTREEIAQAIRDYQEGKFA